MEEKRRGNQFPTLEHVLPYQQTEGPRAIESYEKSGRTAQDWQKNLVNDILAVNDDGLWTHAEYGYSVPRQNGKNEVIAIVEKDGIEQGLRQLHTAHRTSTSSAAWARLKAILEASGYHEKNAEHPDGFRAGKSKGQEFIEFQNGGKIWFRTRTTTGGLGETFDRLIIDEAQEYLEDQDSALKYTIVSSPNPQTIYLGTPPTPYSSGTLFPKYRRQTLLGDKEDCGWAEWSVEAMTDTHDVDAWYRTNPNLGYMLTERAIKREIGDDDVDFNVQRLGLWLEYNQKSAITKTEWDALKIDHLPDLCGKMCIGVKFGQDGAYSALSIAVNTNDGNVFHETIACRSMRDGVDWIADFARKATYCKIVVDGQNGAELLKQALKDYGLKQAYNVTVRDFIDANALFEQGVFGGTLQHMEQPAVTNIATNCDKRTIGSHGGFGYKSLRVSAEISILDSIILAVWGLKEFSKKTARKQIVC